YTQYPGIEIVSNYRKGGFHPVTLGDIFINRHRVVDKLGYGSYSTIWLVEDLDLKRYASVKIIAAEASETSSEIEIAQYLKQQQEKKSSHPGSEHVVQIYDTFVMDSPNGTHNCIVTRFSAQILRRTSNAFMEMPPNIAKKIVAQVCSGVAFLHSCGIVHG
ncbi:kinase-like domain-containing protein, partial [Cyathus striatus]